MESVKTEVIKTLPTPGDLHFNATLTNFAVAWKQEAVRFVAGRMFGEVPVDKQNDKYFVWDEGDFFRDEAELKTPNSDPPMLNLRLSTDQYFCDQYHIGGLVSEADLANQDAAVNKEESVTRAIVNKLLIKREAEWISSFFTGGKWTGSTTAADLVGGTHSPLWSNYTTSDPVRDLRAQISYLVRLGLDPKDLKLGLGQDVFSVLLDHPKFLERYEQVQASILNEQLMAAVLGIGEVMVARASKATSAENASPATISYMHAGHALLVYAPAGVSVDMPSAGKMFTWTGLTGAGENGIRVRRWWDNDKSGWKIVGDSAFDAKLTSSRLGVFFQQYI